MVVEEVGGPRIQSLVLRVEHLALIRIEGADQASHRRADDDVDGNLLLLENSQRADVGKAARATSAEGDGDLGADFAKGKIRPSGPARTAATGKKNGSREHPAERMDAASGPRTSSFSSRRLHPRSDFPRPPLPQPWPPPRTLRASCP